MISDWSTCIIESLTKQQDKRSVMVHIFADILSLVQYIDTLKREPEKLRLDHCLCCGKSNPWLHGGYFRESDRINPSSTSLNSVFIQRYYCPSCQKTCSVLPEFIQPRRWYLWDMQQVIMDLGFKSLLVCEKCSWYRWSTIPLVLLLIALFVLEKPL